MRRRATWLVVCLLATLVACGQGHRPECDGQQAVVDDLRADQVLTKAPPGVTRQSYYDQRPCDDEDAIGTVGWHGALPTADRPAVLDFYRTEVVASGWRLVTDTEGPTTSISSLVTSELCFANNTTTPLRVTVEGNPRESTSEIWVEFRPGSAGCQ
ncbi:hypothetical protein [Actinokineospora globicatena]|uniref:hypothetical protein n=1 Tax=Actinokineospora globicatena TaxID=103729 RepID=UPI0020A38AA8|nr:hypothetical protein [Actinokineospora globicatena]MCP2303389.1 hypothetical protein [Actinokineospora globicatena]GLW79477.1 hypothetical protein Aglo01_39590 [Actinokineospora globicatena]